MEWLANIVSGIYYLLSPTYRQKKHHQWKNEGTMVKIFDIGMWLTTLLIIVFVIIALAVL
ncbi:MAG: hypothetical protein AMJ53_17375 [Gammaproteobacteria bacterium SG8_11]|nr:MAG: hypothetical protein AMJ53_17375 [Gammaproteobacteria bacterium SG8_11]